MLRNLVKISPIPIIILLLVQISNVVNEKAPELPPHLQELISEVATNNIQNPGDLPTWLLAFFMSYERFRHCATKSTCPKNDAFTNLEDLRHKISSYVQSNNVKEQKNKQQKYTTFDEVVDPVYYNDELYARQPDASYSVPSQQNYFQSPEDYSTNDQQGAFSFQKFSKPQSNNYENPYGRRFEQLEQSSFPQPTSYQPRPFGFQNTDYQREKQHSKKSIEFYHHDHSPIHVPLPVHIPVHTPIHVPVHVPVPVVQSYYQPNHDLYVQCLKAVQICVPSEHCHNGHVYGIDPVASKNGDFCNIHTHICCHLPIKEEPKHSRLVTFHKPATIVNQISNGTIKELNNKIVKYIFLGRHNLTIPLNESLHILTAENITNILPELMEGNMTGLYDILHDSNILVNTSDLIMNTIINSTIEKVNNYISQYFFLHPNQNISFGGDLDISSTQMTNVETTTEFDISKNLTFQILEDLRNINRTIISLQQNSSSSIEDLNKLITQQTQSLINIQRTTTPKQTFEENSDSSFQDVETTSTTTTTTTTTPPPRKYLPPDNVYLPPKPSNAYIPQPSNVYIPQEHVDINQRISDTDGLAVPFSDVFGSAGAEAPTPIPSTLKPSSTPSTSTQTSNPTTQMFIAASSQVNLVNNPVVETTAATTSTQNFVTLVSNCPASMSCTREMFCDRAGFITDIPVSEAERVNGVVLMDCENKANRLKGKCCRNRESSDRLGGLQLIF